MDDLKLYAKNEKGLPSLVHIVHGCSQDIGMQFGVAKCATVVLKAGKHAASDLILLPDRSSIRSLQPEETYKYFGFLEAGGMAHSSMNTKILQEYKWRVRRVLRSALNGHSIITAINTWAVALIRYSAGILAWMQDELKSADRRTRKLLTMHGALHPRADEARMHVSRKEVGRGLQSIRDVVTMERSNLQRYVLLSDEELLKVAAPILWPHQDAPPDSSQVVKCRRQKEHLLAWTQKHLHGQFVQQTDQLTNENTWSWLTKAGRRKTTQSLIIAAQDQALATNLLKAQTFHQGGSHLCRMRGKAGESVAHILCEC